jgi:hypothetical protein
MSNPLQWDDQQLAEEAAKVRFTHADQDRIDQEARRLATDPALEGYVPGYPTWGWGLGRDIDANIAATSTCGKCGRYGRGHEGFVAADGSHSWRGFAICPSCGTAEEF